MKIDLTQNSTKRGLVWAITFIVGGIGWWFGKDVTGIILLGSGVAGGIGIIADDKVQIKEEIEKAS